MLDHPRSAISGLSLVLKFGVDPIYGFGDIAIFIFCRFGKRQTPIHAHFWGVLGAYFPQIWSPIVLTPKKTILARKHVVWAIKRENRSGSLTWAHDRGKRSGQDRTVKKSQGGNISPIWGEAPTVPIETKICLAGNLGDVIKCAKFQDNYHFETFQGLQFYRGSNFPFSCWFLRAPYNSAALLRCVWYLYSLSWQHKTNSTMHKTYTQTVKYHFRRKYMGTVHHHWNVRRRFLTHS